MNYDYSGTYMPIPLQNNIIYGPVNSRRLGRSLGINCFIPKDKICSLNCLYCQYGYTRIGEAELHDPENYYPVDEILGALKEYLVIAGNHIDAITLSGNGEATAHPQFPEIVEGILLLRNTLAPGVQTAILSNSTMLGREHVRSALSRLDNRIMKLDCGTEECFRRYNRPVIGVTLENIIYSLRNMEDIIIQTLFTGGPEGNASAVQVDAWIRQVRGIGPRHVQIYSLARPFPSRHIEPLDKQSLSEIGMKAGEAGIETTVY